MAVTTFRDTILRIVPPWLRRGTAAKILYSCAIMLDALGDALVSGVKLRFPGVYSPESLALIGRDRQISRGRLESNDNYAARLIRWWDDHRVRGNAYALFRQLRGHFSPIEFTVEVVYRSGTRITFDADGETVTYDTVAAFNPDGPDGYWLEAYWSRVWVYLHWPVEVADDGIWDDPGVWDDGGVWDSELTSQEVDDIRGVIRDWSAAHVRHTHVVLKLPSTAEIEVG